MGASAEASAVDVTVAVAHAAFRVGGAWSGIQCAGPRGGGVDSVLESLPRLAAEQAFAKTWWVKSESFVMTSMAISDTPVPKAVIQAEHVTIHDGKHLPNVLALTEEPV